MKKSAESNQADKKTLQTQLTEAKNEAKGLQAKLTAARTSSVDAGTSKVPGSAIKQNGGRTILVGAAEGAKEAQKRLLKEELYRDLTGLLVMDVKRRETDDGEEDVFDCIQTGRNGCKFESSNQNDCVLTRISTSLPPRRCCGRNQQHSEDTIGKQQRWGALIRRYRVPVRAEA